MDAAAVRQGAVLALLPAEAAEELPRRGEAAAVANDPPARPAYPGASGGGLHRRLCLHHLPDDKQSGTRWSISKLGCCPT